jgi:ribosome maturation factor RimP
LKITSFYGCERPIFVDKIFQKKFGSEIKVATFAPALKKRQPKKIIEKAEGSTSKYREEKSRALIP